MAVALKRFATGLVELVRELALEPEDATGGPQDVVLETPISVIEHEDWVASVKLWREHGAALIDAVPDRSCPACAAADHRRIFESFDRYPFHACDDCGTWFVPKRVDTDLFERFFDACPEARALAERITRTRMTADRAEQDIARVAAYLAELEPYVEAGTAPRSYLDIGCNVGHSLTAAAAAGYAAHGIDTDADALTIARDSGLSVSAPGTALPGDGYAVMSLWETLEHIHDPRGVLAEWLPALAKDGVLAMTFPNLNAPPVRLLRAECPWVFGGVNTPGHLNLFNVDGIGRLLASLGMRVIDADAQYGMNRRELALFALGAHRGVHDYLAGTSRTHAVPDLAVRLDNAIGPPLVLAERLMLLSPILRIVACREEAYDDLAPVAARVQHDRRRSIAAEAEGLMENISLLSSAPVDSAASGMADQVAAGAP